MLLSTFAIALISGSFAIGSIIGPQTFRAKDAPQYIPAKIAALATQAGAVFVAVIIRIYYGFQNKRKDRATNPIDNVDDMEWMNCKLWVFRLMSYAVLIYGFRQ